MLAAPTFFYTTDKEAKGKGKRGRKPNSASTEKEETTLESVARSARVLHPSRMRQSQ